MEYVEENGYIEKMVKYLEARSGLDLYEDLDRANLKCVKNETNSDYRESSSGYSSLDGTMFNYSHHIPFMIRDTPINIPNSGFPSYLAPSINLRPNEHPPRINIPLAGSTSNLPTSLQSVTTSPKRKKPSRKTKSDRFECILCKKTFAQRLHLDGHLLNKHKDIPNVEKTVRSKIHYCDFCEFRTINTYNLTAHLMTKHGHKREAKHELKTLTCAYCSYSTYNKGNLVTHQRTHSPTKPFSCADCKQSFNQKYSLDAHYLKRHTNETEDTSIDKLITRKVFECSICLYKTSDKNLYVKHFRAHEGSV